MAEDLKKETTRSILWNAIDKVGFQVVAFVVGLVTLRLLSPGDFGLIGALAIFTALSNILTESGFTSAMVRRKHNTDAEYVAVLCFNVFLGLAFYLLLFLCSGWIAEYYRMPELASLAPFLFLSIVFNSFGVVQSIVLTRNLAFKKMSVASLISALVSGILTIAMIFMGYGYWSLAWQVVLQPAIRVVLLWVFSDWWPRCKPDFSVIRELFTFSFSLIASSLMNTFVRYVYNPIIGRYFGDERLGYYSESYKFYFLPVNIVASTFSGVAYPVLSKLNDDEPRQLNYLRKMMRMVAFCIFPIMSGAMACFDNVVEVVLTEKWMPIVPYFRVLAIAGLVAPMHSMYLNLMVVKGFPKKNFELEVIRNALTLLLLLLFHDTIEQMLWGFVAANLLSYVVDLFFVRKVVRYSIREQLWDVFPYLFISCFMAATVFLVGCLDWSAMAKLIVQLLVGVTAYILPAKVLGSNVLNDVIAVLTKKNS
ncbi:MAG: lipopolysaccharide biosynthesis protein [Paludibacteraceae bacterium]|nr:lipopolysaccharide biosynthesis protein [Paludibacteraceae bacterium]